MSQDLAATSGVTEVDERSHGLLSRLLAETFGTFLLTLVIVGVLVYSPLNTVGGLGVALGGAFAYIAGAAAVGRVSGAHFNPAISLGAWLGGRISVGTALGYWVAQIVGAVLAGAVLFATYPRALITLLQNQNPDMAGVADVFDNAVNGFGENSPLYLQTQGGAQFEWLAAILVETIISAVLVGVYLGATASHRRAAFAPAAVGSAIAALTLISFFVTNTGMNPARSTAAALFANDWGSGGSGRQLWLFWVAPLVGAALAALFYRAFGTPEDDELLLVEGDDEEDAAEPATVPATEPAEPATVPATEPAEPATVPATEPAGTDEADTDETDTASTEPEKKA